MGDYVLIDEVKPGPWARQAVRPLWIVAGLLFAGAWFGVPWLVFNAHAAQSPTRSQEVGLAIGYLVGAGLLSALVGVGVWYGIAPGLVDYLMLSVVALKLLTAFWVGALQSPVAGQPDAGRSFEVMPLSLIAAAYALRFVVVPDGTGPVQTILRAVIG